MITNGTLSKSRHVSGENTMLDGWIGMVCSYLDDLLCTSKGLFKDHLYKLEETLKQLYDVHLKVNSPKSELRVQELEHFGYLSQSTGVFPIAKKVKATLRLQPPTMVQQLKSFLGIVNYYQDI